MFCDNAIVYYCMVFVNDINRAFETMILADQDDRQPCFSADRKQLLPTIDRWSAVISCPDMNTFNAYNFLLLYV
jgi:hypothetical protein